MNKFFVLFLAGVFLQLEWLNAQSCETIKDSLLATFSMYPNKEMNLKWAQSGEAYQQTISFKFPNSTSEIKETTILDCPPYLPPGVTVRDIKVQKMVGLPEGLTYTCETSDCFWKQAEYGCVTITGTPIEQGEYPIKVYVKGIANVLFMPISVECVLEGYTLVVK